MEETYLPAFEACVKEGKVEAVMEPIKSYQWGTMLCHSEIDESLSAWKMEISGTLSDCWAIRDFTKIIR